MNNYDKNCVSNALSTYYRTGQVRNRKNVLLYDIFHRDVVNPSLIELTDQLLFMEYQSNIANGYEGEAEWNPLCVAYLLTINPGEFDFSYVGMDAVFIACIAMACYILSEDNYLQPEIQSEII